MGFNFGNNTKASCQKLIKSKQAFFNRMKRRYKVSCDPSERRFLKSEATRVCNELKQCCKQWKNCGYGACTWITKSFTVGCFNSVKNTVRKQGRKSYARTSSRRTRRTSARRPKARTSSRGRTSARRSYVAW